LEALKQFFEHSGIHESSIEIILSKFQQKEFSKGEYFLKEGHCNQWLGLIEKGNFQYFCTNDGNEITTYVASSGGFLVSPGSFLRQTPARENIRALTVAKIWVLTMEHFRFLKTEIPEFKNLYLNILENQLICIEESRFDMITLSAEERYKKLLEQEPMLLQEIPLQFLASILGITPRHLSRIRKNIR
jgi:CRP-like cAMP-binding protein